MYHPRAGFASRLRDMTCTHHIDLSLPLEISPTNMQIPSRVDDKLHPGRRRSNAFPIRYVPSVKLDLQRL